MIKNPYFHPQQVIPPEQKEFVETQIYTSQGHEVTDVPAGQEIVGLTSIVIPAYLVNYPLFHNTGNCIGSIREHTDMEKTPYEIILILNGKDHILIENMDSTFCDKVISNEKNMGFSYAVNQGIRVSSGEYIAVINNDVQVFSHWLEDFHEALKHLDLVMATPMYGIAYAREVEAQKFREKTMGQDITETFSTFNDFSCICAKKKLFTDIGMFDEKFFAYKEDIDLFKRMNTAEKKYATTKRVNTHHIIGSTSVNLSPEEVHHEEGEEYYRQKYG